MRKACVVCDLTEVISNVTLLVTFLSLHTKCVKLLCLHHWLWGNFHGHRKDNCMYVLEVNTLH